jgi:redox-sensitive bicupin YhaK (pirin superfamily)
MNPNVDIRRANERMHTEIGWLDSWHSFSFGNHYDPKNTHHGLLLVHNDDRVVAGSGFGTHPHRDMEIVTWVLEGRLAHRDSAGHDGVIEPGLAQRMSAGTGIMHSEMNASADEPVHFIQMVHRRRGYAPATRRLRGRGARCGGLSRWHRVGDAAIHINQRDASLYVARLAAAGSVEVPDAPHVHLFVAVGDAELEDAGDLREGDAVRLTAAGQRRITAGSDGAEIIVWATTELIVAGASRRGEEPRRRRLSGRPACTSPTGREARRHRRDDRPRLRPAAAGAWRNAAPLPRARGTTASGCRSTATTGVSPAARNAADEIERRGSRGADPPRQRGEPQQ